MVTRPDPTHDEVCDCTRCMIGRMNLRERRQEADRRISGFAVAVERRSGRDRRGAVEAAA